ncbi:MAG TPA: hypothetical protein VEH06_11665 [Candidatus Bathyarchaeia archaeon]|nr:hypothetical protein [Candidatus Bathyarchaeia archaeon]
MDKFSLPWKFLAFLRISTKILNYDNKNENLRQFDLKNSIDLRNDGVSQININNVSAAARSLTRGVCK